MIVKFCFLSLTILYHFTNFVFFRCHCTVCFYDCQFFTFFHSCFLTTGCTNGWVRIVGGPSDTRGRVEICIGTTWGTVANYWWNDQAAMVVCQQLYGDMLMSKKKTFYNLQSDREYFKFWTISSNERTCSTVYEVEFSNLFVRASITELLYCYKTVSESHFLVL